MFIAEWERPETNLELYPEKQWKQPGFLERIILNGNRYFRKGPSLSQMYEFARRVEKAGNEYSRISERQIPLCARKINLVYCCKYSLPPRALRCLL